MIDRVDQNIGRLVKKLKGLKQLDNTLILFLSDNGGCAEGGTFGQGDFNEIRNLENNPTMKVGKYKYGKVWANLSNTPYSHYKHWAHEGGIGTPMIAHWPKGISLKKGSLTSQPAHIIDFMATVVDIAGAKYPFQYKGNKIEPMEGTSLNPLFEGQHVNERSIYIEHEGNCAILKGPWKLVSDSKKWELYNLDDDRTETNNLVDKHPVRVKEMQTEWLAWARRINVFPAPKKHSKKHPVSGNKK